MATFVDILLPAIFSGVATGASPVCNAFTLSLRSFSSLWAAPEIPQGRCYKSSRETRAGI